MDRSVKEAFLNNVARLDIGSRSALKRAAGSSMSKAGNMKAVNAFNRCLPEYISDKLRERWFTVACLQCYWGTPSGQKMKLEKMVRQMRENDMLSSSLSKKVDYLLGNDWTDGGIMARRLNDILKTMRMPFDGTAIDFLSLLEDLETWNSTKAMTKMRWSKTMFGPAPNVKSEFNK